MLRFCMVQIVAAKSPKYFYSLLELRQLIQVILLPIRPEVCFKSVSASTKKQLDELYLMVYSNLL